MSKVKVSNVDATRVGELMLQGVREFTAEDCSLEYLPPGLLSPCLTSLQTIDLSGNSLVKFPDPLFECPHLKAIGIREACLLGFIRKRGLLSVKNWRLCGSIRDCKNATINSFRLPA